MPFELYEPHQQYVRAALLREDNFADVAMELSKDGYDVAMNYSWGKPQSVTVVGKELASPVTCYLYQCFVRAADVAAGRLGSPRSAQSMAQGRRRPVQVGN
jgi:hypothetical protein